MNSNVSILSRLKAQRTIAEPAPLEFTHESAQQTNLALCESLFPGSAGRYFIAQQTGGLNFRFETDSLIADATLSESGRLNFTGPELSSHLRQNGFTQGSLLSKTETQFLFQTLREFVTSSGASLNENQIVGMRSVTPVVVNESADKKVFNLFNKIKGSFKPQDTFILAEDGEISIGFHDVTSDLIQDLPKKVLDLIDEVTKVLGIQPRFYSEDEMPNAVWKGVDEKICASLSSITESASVGVRSLNPMVINVPQTGESEIEDHDFDQVIEAGKPKRGRPPKMVKRIRGGEVTLVRVNKKKRTGPVSAGHKAAQKAASIAGNKPAARKKAAKSLAIGRKKGLYEELED